MGTFVEMRRHDRTILRVREFNVPAVAAALGRYLHRWASVRLLCFWRRTYPDRRWWLDAVLSVGYCMRVLRGDRVSPKLAEQCERVRWELIQDMGGE